MATEYEILSVSESNPSDVYRKWLAMYDDGVNPVWYEIIFGWAVVRTWNVTTVLGITTRTDMGTSIQPYNYTVGGAQKMDLCIKKAHFIGIGLEPTNNSFGQCDTDLTTGFAANPNY